MANGRLGSGVSVTGTNVVYYTVPNNVEFATITICVTSRSSNDVTMKLSVGPSTIPNLEDYLEYDTVLPAYGMLERTCVVVSTGEKVILNANSDDLSIRIHGLEQPMVAP